MLPPVEVLICELARSHLDRLLEGRRPYRAKSTGEQLDEKQYDWSRSGVLNAYVRSPSAQIHSLFESL
jgi:hypothetical protein